jgi:hypothetical protein
MGGTSTLHGWPMSKASTVEIAALIAATDKDGRVDPTRYEAERLILENMRIGGIDADALASSIPSSPAFEQDRDGLLRTIGARLDSPQEKNDSIKRSTKQTSAMRSVSAR